MAAIGGLGIGIILWFSLGGRFEERRAVIYTRALTLALGSIFYFLAYAASFF